MDNKTPNQETPVEELLKEYNEQTESSVLTHSYSELFHRDSYSDSDCCC